ncbi:response regulator [Polaromonas sp. P1-6]|nr:response regulator [Polaromonas sp. P1-6]
MCEDDPDVARLIGMMLDKGGFEADMVHSAAQALELLTIQAYAAMTVDLRLPDQDGASLIQYAARRKAHTASSHRGGVGHGRRRAIAIQQPAVHGVRLA